MNFSSAKGWVKESPKKARFLMILSLPFAIPYCILCVVKESWGDIWEEFTTLFKMSFSKWDFEEKD